MSNGATTSPLWPADNPATTAHMTMLQSIISRLANNSAACKTWCLTLVGALVSLAGATKVPGIITFTLIPITIFGFLDTMYLAQEKAYRALFNDVVGQIRAGTYCLTDTFEAKAALKLNYVGQALKSWSIWPVYLGLIAAYLFAYYKGWLGLLTAPAAK
ncbi:MAG TPA: hypothetical protein VGW32_03785 [Pyrinomonadaceae bacterium]|nr:hypothetical protein [Pyrinomonadaceae bacterium]